MGARAGVWMGQLQSNADGPGQAQVWPGLSLHDLNLMPASLAFALTQSTARQSLSKHERHERHPPDASPSDGAAGGGYQRDESTQSTNVTAACRNQPPSTGCSLKMPVNDVQMLVCSGSWQPCRSCTRRRVPAAIAAAGFEHCEHMLCTSSPGWLQTLGHLPDISSSDQNCKRGSL